MRTEPCLCGGAIVARTIDEQPEAVRRHQATARHREWQAARWAGTPARPRIREAFQRVACIGVGDRGCLTMVPPDRVRCRYCVRTIQLSGALA